MFVFVFLPASKLNSLFYFKLFSKLRFLSVAWLFLMTMYNLVKVSNKFLTNFESTTKVELCKPINFSISLKKILEIATSRKSYKM